MQKSWFNSVLWQYSPTVPTERLIRHYRICDRLTRLWLWSVVTMLAGLCQLLLFKNTYEIVIVLVAAGLGLLVSVPAIVSRLWQGDIERILRERGVELPAVKALERDSAIYFLKMFLWFGGIILIGAWLSRGN